MNKPLPSTPDLSSAPPLGILFRKNESLENLFSSVAEFDDFHAFEAIFHRTYQNLLQFSLKYVKIKELGEEVVDDVFFNLWKNRKVINIQISLKSYLMTSVRNKALDYIRAAKNINNCTLEKALNLPCSQNNAFESLAQAELSEKMEKAIHSLPKQCRLIFLMSREQGMKYKEIAEKLNLSVKTIDTQMGRALKHLREKIYC